jgi:NifU-like protein involved in Fe-S cluster formation
VHEHVNVHVDVHVDVHVVVDVIGFFSFGCGLAAPSSSVVFKIVLEKHEFQIS